MPRREPRAVHHLHAGVLGVTRGKPAIDTIDADAVDAAMPLAHDAAPTNSVPMRYARMIVACDFAPIASAISGKLMP